MQWLVGSCYAGSVVLYLIVKTYYENELKKSARDRSFCHDCCDCSRGLCYDFTY